MRLLPMTLDQLTPGQLVAFRPLYGSGRDAQSDNAHVLRVVDRVVGDRFYLSPVSLFLDSTSANEYVSLHDAGARLLVPIIEVGDAVLLRGRPAIVSQCLPNDFHVYVKLCDPPNFEVYTNLIHLDFYPTLVKFAAAPEHSTAASA